MGGGNSWRAASTASAIRPWRRRGGCGAAQGGARTTRSGHRHLPPLHKPWRRRGGGRSGLNYGLDHATGKRFIRKVDVKRKLPVALSPCHGMISTVVRPVWLAFGVNVHLDRACCKARPARDLRSAGIEGADG